MRNFKMILGNIQQLSAYLNPEIVQPIFRFLDEQNLLTIVPGRHSVAANGIFAIVIKTDSRNLKGQEFEAHRQNLDLHYLVSGKEVLGFTDISTLEIAAPYVMEEDYLLYHYPQQHSLIGLMEKQFVLFFPEDAHCAQGHIDRENPILKIVFKIPVTLLKEATTATENLVQNSAININLISDLEQALPILWEHDQKMQKLNFPESYPNKEMFEKRIRQEYEAGAAYFFIYEAGKIVGSLILMTKENPYRRRKYGDIRNIYLEPECRGKGYGKKMLKFADQYFKEKNCSFAFAGIAAHNPASNALFERAGYSKTRYILEKNY